MSFDSRRRKECIFYNVYFVQRKFFLAFVFYLNVKCIEQTFRILIFTYQKTLLHKLSKAFSVKTQKQ